MDKFDLTGTKTADNLATLFAAESMARNRYTFYADTANEEKLECLANLFLETADNERGHAEIIYDYLTTGLTGPIEITVPEVVSIEAGTTRDNLAEAAKLENNEGINLYPRFAEVAEAEGFSVIAITFSEIATIELHHYNLFRSTLERFNKGMLFNMPYTVTWECLNCGLLVNGPNAPKTCPACHHPQDFFHPVRDDIFDV